MNSYKKLDLILFAALTLLCFFSFQHGDQIDIIRLSSALTNGHFFDFYDFNLTIEPARIIGYFPSIYVIFGLWGLPLKLFGVISDSPIFVGCSEWRFLLIIWYFKLCTTIFYGLTGYLLYKTGKLLNASRTSSSTGFDLVAFVLTQPILIFGQFIFSQTDIIGVFFITLALYFLLQKRMILFSLLMGFSITFKLFPIFFYIPLLLLLEKKPLQLIKHVLVFLIPISFFFLLFWSSPGFHQTALSNDNVGRLYTVSINNGIDKTSILLLVWFFICGYCYLKNIDKKPEQVFQWAAYIGTVAFSCLFGFMFWHPQWLTLLVLFFSLSTFLNPLRREFLILDGFMMLAFIAIVVKTEVHASDTYLMQQGIWSALFPRTHEVHKIARFGLFYFTKIDLWYALFNSALLLNCVFKHPNYHTAKKLLFTDNLSTLNSLRFRYYFGVGTYVVLSFFAFFLPPRG